MREWCPHSGDGAAGITHNPSAGTRLDAVNSEGFGSVEELQGWGMNLRNRLGQADVLRCGKNFNLPFSPGHEVQLSGRQPKPTARQRPDT
jgi:hypothetical protein